MRNWIVFLTLLLGSCFAVAQTAGKTHHAAPPPATTTAAPPAPAMSDADVQALRADIARMKVTLTQLQNNLAFVTNMQDPLKHEFQLEFDMWNVVIGDMQRRLDAATKK